MKSTKRQADLKELLMSKTKNGCFWPVVGILLVVGWVVKAVGYSTEPVLDFFTKYGADTVQVIVSIIGISVFIYIYFLPTIIAFNRSHRNRWIIFILNIFGASIIPWVIGLVWALNKIDDPVKGGHQIDGQDGDRHL